ncbi:MAG: hypothetical protein QOE14_3080, partial [Humisphaera sp.]|nr:hypothetical protein [Humisphaera sp.]
VKTAGLATFTFRLAITGSKCKFHAEIEGVNVTCSMTVPNTAGWQKWANVTKSGVKLTAGVHVLRVKMDANGSTGSVGNFNWMKMQMSATPTAVALKRGNAIWSLTDERELLVTI